MSNLKSTGSFGVRLQWLKSAVQRTLKIKTNFVETCKQPFEIKPAWRWISAPWSRLFALPAALFCPICPRPETSFAWPANSRFRSRRSPTWRRPTRCTSTRPTSTRATRSSRRTAKGPPSSGNVPSAITTKCPTRPCSWGRPTKVKLSFSPVSNANLKKAKIRNSLRLRMDYFVHLIFSAGTNSRVINETF